MLANLTDASAKGFEDRVIRVLEMLVPATSNTTSTAASTRAGTESTLSTAKS